MNKPTGTAVAAQAIQAVAENIPYSRMDCQAFVEEMVRRAGGSMAYTGSNAMARGAVWLGTIENARAEKKLAPGAGVLILEDDESGLPPNSKYRGDGLGDYSHVGLYVGENALEDVDKYGKKRKCNVVHSGETMGRVAGSTLANGYTHVIWYPEIDYGQVIKPGVSLGAGLAPEDITREDPEGLGQAASVDRPPDVSKFYTVKRGSLGGAVRRLQTWMQDIGHALEDDGEFGPLTEAAVREFQGQQGLVADGVVGQKTWAALAKVRWEAMERSDQ